MREYSDAEASLRQAGLKIVKAALAAADAGNTVRSHLNRSENKLRLGPVEFDLSSFERVTLLAVGKAAAPMAQAVQRILGQCLSESVVLTKEGHSGALLGAAIESGHPIPNQVGVEAAYRIKQLLERSTAHDLIILALSGGASALLPAPEPPITLEDKQRTTDLLLRAGANIRQLNAVRKHLSFLKGGKLAKLAWPSTTIGLLLSDVINDSLDVIGSGPTAPDPTSFADALSVLRQFGLIERIPPSVLGRLLQGVAGSVEETPKPGDPIFRKVHNFVVGSNRLALDAAAMEAERLGFHPIIVSSCVEGEAREAAVALCGRLRDVAARKELLPACLLAGGETTVTVRGPGKGGRNQEFALAAGLEIAGLDGVAVFSVGTDGTDGPTDAAGAVVTGTTVARALARGVRPVERLASNDSYVLFDALDDLVRTGPTGTNVMDIQIMLAGLH